MSSKKKQLILKTALLLIGAFFLWFPAQAQEKKVELYFFGAKDCFQCDSEKLFLADLSKRYPEIKMSYFDISQDPINYQMMSDLAEAYNFSEPIGVPMLFAGGEVFLGFGAPEGVGKRMEETVKKCLAFGCPELKDVLGKNLAVSLVSDAPDSTNPLMENSPVCIHYFVKSDCPPCDNLLPFLKDISQKYGVELKIYDTSTDKTNQKLYSKLQEFYHLDFSGFPIVFLGDSYLLGDERIRENLEGLVSRCQKNGCFCPVDEIKSTLTQIPKIGTFLPETKDNFTVEFFGKKINISSGLSLPLLGAGLGLIDGFNPCMFSVLLFLLTYLLSVGSRKKAIKMGLVFVASVFAIYFLFMFGLLNLITLIGWIQKIKKIIAFIALIAGLIMIKDYFFYGKWISLNIPQATKPAFKKLIERGTVLSAIILALLSTLVELPCTSGIPLVYVTLLAQKGGYQIPALLWYNLFFILPLLFVIGLFALAWVQLESVEKWKLSSRKYMRLLSGAILLFLAISLFKGWM